MLRYFIPRTHITLTIVAPGPGRWPAIAAARDDTIGALAGRSGLEQSILSRNLPALERSGLVEITIAGEDFRQSEACGPLGPDP